MLRLIEQDDVISYERALECFAPGLPEKGKKEFKVKTHSVILILLYV